MLKMGVWLRTFAFWLVLVPTTVLLSLMAIAISPLDRRGDLIHRIARLWAKVLLWAAGVRVRVEGLSHIPPGPVVFMCNHQSALDIFVILSCLPVQFRWLAKASLFRIPFLGWAMACAKYIPVERENPREATRSLVEAARRVREGTSLVIFPEGTRSRDEGLLPFKKGGFTLALKAQVPVVPMAIVGTRELMPRGSLRVSGGEVRMRIAPPIETEGMGIGQRDDLILQVRRAIEGCRGEGGQWQGR